MAAPKGNNFNPAGRPRKDIDWTQFEKLCSFQCTQVEIASFFNMHIDTLRIHVKQNYSEDYTDVYKKYSESGKCSLRRIQFRLAHKSASMAIWLGKQWLGQRDISKDEIKDLKQEILDAIRESETRDRIEEAPRLQLENQQPILYQGRSREEGEVPNELGSEGIV